ncbi:unnamed protein product [Polarella glacialis]|uniref:Phospholipase B-like n=1 Tax=Polarella glacialis TaxID=89957 RepID=A0A813LNT8_POLGL|nr:unnamed protein product [Polarella glacialis]
MTALMWLSCRSAMGRCLLVVLALCRPSGAADLQLYFYAQGNLRSPPFLGELTTLMDEARGCGYDGMFYSDSDIQTMHIENASNDMFWSSLGKMQRHAQQIGLELVPLIFPFGPSDPIFQQPKWGYNLAEALAFRGALFEVDAAGRHLDHIDEFAGLENGDFSRHIGDQFAGWVQDAPGERTFAESLGCHSPGGCLRVGPGTGDGLAMQPLLGVGGHSQLHVSFFARSSSNFSAVQYNLEVREVLPVPAGTRGVHARMGRRLSWWSLKLEASEAWQRFEYVAPSWDGSRPVGIFLGVEARGAEGQQGELWFDDVSVSTTALINVIRRAGAPLRVYDADSEGGAEFTEGLDFEPVIDPLAFQNGVFDSLHPAPVVRLPRTGSSLKPKQRVRIDYFAVSPVFGSGVASCLLHEGVFEYMRQNSEAVAKNYNWAGFLMSYDEIRQLRTDAAETEQFATPGQLLAWHVANATRTVRSGARNNPTAQIYVWDDMFSPFHNAGYAGSPEDAYFLANGSLRGSWEGLVPKENTVLSWGPCDEAEEPTPGEPPCRFRRGLEFFAGRGLQQMIGGYYDYSPCKGCARNGTAAAEREFRFAAGIEGIEGFSYTTWGSNNEAGKPNYEQMCDYAHTLRRLHSSSQEVPLQV